MGNEETTKAAFETWAKGLSAYSMELGHRLPHRWWLQKLSSPQNGKVLDMGCGTGWASRMVARVAPDGEVVGIDFVEGMIEKAKQFTLKDKSHKYGNLSFMVADVEDIPYPDDYFHSVMCLESFSWFPNPEAALREMKRVLRPAGKLYVADIADSRSARLILKAWRLFIPGLDKWNIYSENLFKELVEAEFTDLHQEKGSWIFSPFGERVLLTVGTKKE